MYMTVDIEIPDWANWIAQDNSGEWFFYKDEPVRSKKYLCWLVSQDSEIAYVGSEPDDWTQEIYQIVR